MLLKLFSNNHVRIIRLDKSFFYKNSNPSPKEKAFELGQELLGRQYEGHILEFNGTEIQNTLGGTLDSISLSSRSISKGKSAKNHLGGSGHLPLRIGQILGK